MKFYIISAILNTAFLFIPVALPVINSLKQDNVPVITVNLENSVFEEIKGGKAEENKNDEKQKEPEKKTENKENTVIQEKKDKK
ncbi:MAG: hypothetical protein Q4D53_06305 [Leptotrichiaceae bacterium]|nr:hypothetical protein [Leptotrichiaceae bacterium]